MTLPALGKNQNQTAQEAPPPFLNKRIPPSKRCVKGGIFCLRGLGDGMLGGRARRRKEKTVPQIDGNPFFVIVSKSYARCYEFRILLDNIYARCYLNIKIHSIHSPLLSLIHINKDGMDAGSIPHGGHPSLQAPTVPVGNLVTTI